MSTPSNQLQLSDSTVVNKDCKIFVHRYIDKYIDELTKSDQKDEAKIKMIKEFKEYVKRTLYCAHCQTYCNNKSQYIMHLQYPTFNKTEEEIKQNMLQINTTAIDRGDLLEYF